MIQLFQSLPGQWHFEREIVDYALAPERITVSGSAVFSCQNKNVLHYREQGVLKKSDGSEFRASRTYIYRYEEGQINVFFDETSERFFHTLHFANDSSATAHHSCGRDTYDALYEFTAPGSFTLSYVVRGPLKNYRMATIYSLLDIFS